MHMTNFYEEQAKVLGTIKKMGEEEASRCAGCNKKLGEDEKVEWVHREMCCSVACAERVGAAIDISIMRSLGK